MVSVFLTTQCFPPNIGGIERYMADIAHQLADVGISVTVFADQSPSRDFDERAPFVIRRFGGIRPLRRLIKAFSLRHSIRNMPDAVILADTWKSVELLNRVTQPIILFAHGNELLIQNEKKRLRSRRAIEKADLVLANSHYTAELARKLGLARETIHVFNIPIADQPEPSQHALAELRDVLGEYQNMIVTIARIEKRKGIDRVIEIMPLLIAHHPKTLYVVAGAGDDRPRLENLAKSHGVEKSVIFLGQINQDMKAALLSLATVFVMPTRLDKNSVEGFGMSYVEAAWYGVPSVAVDSGGVRDAVLDQETGLVCKTDDTQDIFRAVDSLLGEPAWRQRLGDAAQARARNHLNWSNNLAALRQRIEDCVHRRAVK